MDANEPVREWLEADGLGGFAMGSAELVRCRRYHALLCRATTPPTGRVVLVAGQDVELHTAAGRQPLSAQHYAPDVVHPRGDQRVARFAADPWPSWEFDAGRGLRVRHELFVPRGASVVVQRWSLLGDGGAAATAAAGARVELEVRPFLAGRDYHALRREHDGLQVQHEEAGDSVRWQLVDGNGAVGPRIVARGGVASDGVASDGVASDGSEYRAGPLWYRNFRYREETARGFPDQEDLLSPGTFHFDLAQGPAVLVFAAGELPASLRGGDLVDDVAAVAAQERARRQAFASPLHRAAAAYLVARGGGSTLVAGYPWFTDWGRDTFIALRGICHATGNRAAARDILLEWCNHISRGMLPNRFPDQGEVEYHTADAALWFVVAADAHLGSGPVAAEDARRLVRAVLDIVAGYAAGTRHGIRMDAEDGLLRAGEPGRQLTWMDAIVDGVVITPRIGKPVEIQALWGNALAIAGKHEPRWRAIADRVRGAFERRFFDRERGCLYDVVDVDHVPGTVDRRMRPNQIFAVGGLPLAMLSGAPARAVVDHVERRLWTPLGLRTLAADEPGYVGRYAGGPAARDGAYHMGTAWPWLLGPFVEAWLRVHGRSPARQAEAHRRFVAPLLAHLATAGLGHVSEIVDGDPPHTPRGCPFQAWSLAELLRLELDLLAGRELAAESTPSTPMTAPPPAVTP